MPVFQVGVRNAWLLSVPMLLAFSIGAQKKDVARRLSDMSGYDAREKIFTISASLAPYPFMVATVWTPFTSITPLLCAGLALYCASMALLIVTIYCFATASGDVLIQEGPYRISRNPLYVSATLIFLSICLVTANVLLLAWLAIIVVPQHFMILAEERACLEKYGREFERYMVTVPRYLLVL